MEHRCVYKCERCGKEFVAGIPIDDGEIDEILEELGFNIGVVHKYAVHRCMNIYGTRSTDIMGVGRLVGFEDYTQPKEG